MSATSAGRSPLLCEFEHIFLPPKLPAGQEQTLWEGELITRLSKSLRDFRSHVEGIRSEYVDAAISAMENFRLLTSSPAGHEETLGNLLENFLENGQLKRYEVSIKSLTIHRPSHSDEYLRTELRSLTS